MTITMDEEAVQAKLEVILEVALKLPETERLTLVSRLLDTLPAEDADRSLDDAALLGELDRRCNDREGSASWPELRAHE
jgi:putative addiction module component (TIGR02574 family)